MKHCKYASPASRLWTCLAANRRKTSKTCEDNHSRALDDGDWRHKYGLSTKCASERQMLCAGVPAGSGRVVKCLQSKMDHEKMGKECVTPLPRTSARRRHPPSRRPEQIVQGRCQDPVHAGDPGEGRRSSASAKSARISPSPSVARRCFAR